MAVVGLLVNCGQTQQIIETEPFVLRLVPIVKTVGRTGVMRPTKGGPKGGIGFQRFQPVKIVLRMKGWKPIPPLCAHQ